MKESTTSKFRSEFDIRYSIFIILLTLFGCSPSHQELVDSIALQPAPEFNADSAYAHIASQVAFGPRIPGTETHAKCGDHLVAILRSCGAEVIEQRDSTTVAKGVRLPVRNIIASFSPEKKERILLFAHWDSRPMADMDPHRPNEPIEAAHDGASGVGVLLEIARLIGLQQPSVGVDIILFDTEDQGKVWEDGDDYGTEFFFCMGSRLWAARPHVEGYAPRYGIMLDMVAASDARFTLEQHSMAHAGPQMRNIWAIAHRLGFAPYFPFNLTQAVQHDHRFITEVSGIPTLAIMHHDNTSRSTFGSYWHTHSDNLQSVDRNTLKAVGQTVVQTLFNE
ncbi:MAG: M28 family peptidase [Flavobacteriales bacterium]|nr:M28 family peptidase [Flavobacteriales bacterium]